jgi:cytoplasmic iron level regulating protein YaaA (DUF328/UPF0246 family)
MLVVISPAKKLNWSTQAVASSRPEFGKEAISLARTARNLGLGELQKLMDISPDLARLNRDRFRSFLAEPSESDVRPAALAFDGDTYQGLEAGSLDPDEMAWAQDHLRILSGLYGILRPLDAIQPYRLEMGSRLRTRRGKSLYDYWGDSLAKALNRAAEAVGASILVNCASQEYFGAVATKALVPQVVTPSFLEDKDGQTRTVSFFAKRARGAMARFVVQNRVTDATALQDFDNGGYRYRADLSSPDAPAFVRPYPSSVQQSAAAS